MEAALYGAVAGFEVTLFERGRLAENVRAWGHVGLFTEWKRNRSPLAVRLLTQRGTELATPDSYSNGRELAEYVMRLAGLEPLRGRICPQTEVVSLTRDACLKSDFWGEPGRERYPFRLVTRGVAGEKLRFFDAVIDATGVYATPNYVGSGGAPCPGELVHASHIDYQIPDISGYDRGRFANKHTLVVGSGHSAASALLAVADWFHTAPATRITWVVRRPLASSGEVYYIDPDDKISSRRRLGERANLLVHDNRVDFYSGTVIESIARTALGFQVTLSNGQVVECHNLVAHTGFRPDPALWRELQVVEHPATGGPHGLSDVIMENNRRSGVGLSTGYAERKPLPPEFGTEGEPKKGDPRVASPELVRLPEPNFFVIGIKSYGRDAGFLMQNGFRQVRDVYRLMAGDLELDLYNGEI